MKPVRRRRLYILLAVIVSVGIVVTLLLSALKQNINLYLTPSQVVAEHLKPNVEFRLGGWVKEHSVHQGPGLNMTFVVTDHVDDLTVHFVGLPPSLFREGQGVVVDGKLNAQHEMIADQILAKHDADYHPPLPKGAPGYAS